MELTPLSPTPLPGLLFGLGSVLAALTAMALTKPAAPTTYRIARPTLRAPARSVPTPVCKASPRPRWLQCRANGCVIDKIRLQQELVATAGLMTVRPPIFAPVNLSNTGSGQKFYTIPVCSPADWLGLRNGDVIPVGTALHFIAPDVPGVDVPLRKATHFKLEIERSGRRITYDYPLR